MLLLLKAAAGALVVILISMVSRGQNFFLAGLVPLFPTFTLIAHYTVGISRSPEELKTTVLFTMLSMLPYLLYLLAMYVLVTRVNLGLALTCSTLLWCIAAALLVGFWLQAA